MHPIYESGSFQLQGESDKVVELQYFLQQTKMLPCNCVAVVLTKIVISSSIINNVWIAMSKDLQ
jgi:hypothetical protein